MMRQSSFKSGATTKIELDPGRAVTYDQDHESTGFVVNALTVLPSSAQMGDMRVPFRAQRNHPATGHRPKHPRKGKTAAQFRFRFRIETVFIGMSQFT